MSYIQISLKSNNKVSHSERKSYLKSFYGSCYEKKRISPQFHFFLLPGASYFLWMVSAGRNDRATATANQRQRNGEGILHGR